MLKRFLNVLNWRTFLGLGDNFLELCKSLFFNLIFARTFTSLCSTTPARCGDKSSRLRSYYFFSSHTFYWFLSLFDYFLTYFPFIYSFLKEEEHNMLESWKWEKRREGKRREGRSHFLCWNTVVCITMTTKPSSSTVFHLVQTTFSKGGDTL